MSETRSFRDDLHAKLDAATPDERLETIKQLVAVATSATAMALDAIGVAGAAADWQTDGARHLKGWLTQILGVSHHTASRYTDVAKKLPDLPAVADAFCDAE